MNATCPLCAKLQNLPTLAQEVVWEFPNSVAFLGPWQYYDGYCVLVLRQHGVEWPDLAPDVRRGYFDEMNLLAAAILEVVKPRKLNYEWLGNQVPHLHGHLFPRFTHDPDHLRAVWLALDRADRDPEWHRRLSTGTWDRVHLLAQLRVALTRLTGHS